jgi:hypothetical protein
MPNDANLLRAADHVHLEFARSTGRVMVTYDTDYIRLHRLEIEHAGIALIRPRSRNIGQMIELLYLLYELALPDEMINRLEYI